MSPLRKYLDAALVGGVTLLCALVLKIFVVEAFRIPSSSMENTLQVGDLVLVNKLAYGIRTPGAVPFTAGRLTPHSLVEYTSVERGDVIVFEFTLRGPDGIPADLLYYVKRCVGLPGDTVELRQGRLFINGRELLPPATGTMPGFQNAARREALYPHGAGFTDVDYGPLRVPRAGDTLVLDPASAPFWFPILQRDGHMAEIRPNGSVLVDGTACSYIILDCNHYFVLGDHRDNSADSRMWGFVRHDEIIGEGLLVYWSTREPDDRGSGWGTVRWDRIGTLIR
ncbi:MAG: signal peptidase I [Bacteroidota bacterium]